jgi:hypothetical protein
MNEHADIIGIILLTLVGILLSAFFASIVKRYGLWYIIRSFLQPFRLGLLAAFASRRHTLINGLLDQYRDHYGSWDYTYVPIWFGFRKVRVNFFKTQDLEVAITERWFSSRIYNTISVRYKETRFHDEMDYEVLLLTVLESILVKLSFIHIRYIHKKRSKTSRQERFDEMFVKMSGFNEL